MKIASRTASGSRAVQGQRARVASGSRIFVEGQHDAELVEKAWGDDLRVEGVVVEMLHGGQPKSLDAGLPWLACGHRRSQSRA